MSPRQNEIFGPWSRPTPAQIGLVLEGISRRWRRFAQATDVPRGGTFLGGSTDRRSRLATRPHPGER